MMRTLTVARLARAAAADIDRERAAVAMKGDRPAVVELDSLAIAQREHALFRVGQAAEIVVPPV